MWELSQSDTNLAGIVAEVGADPEGLIESQQVLGVGRGMSSSPGEGARLSLSPKNEFFT